MIHILLRFAWWIFRRALRDPGYAWTWHCAIAVAIGESAFRTNISYPSHFASNEAAADVMRALFRLDTRQLDEYAPIAAEGERLKAMRTDRRIKLDEISAARASAGY